MALAMNSSDLRKLPRNKIQSIAKRELVNAAGKTEDIIRRLLTKHPTGVPTPGDSATTPVPPSGKRSLRKKPSKPKVSDSSAADHRSESQNQHRKPNTRKVTAALSPVPEEPQAGPSTGPPKNDIPDREASLPRVEKGPDENMVVDALRAFTVLVDNTPGLKSRIREAQIMLDRTANVIEQMMPDVREICLVREHFEMFLLAKMKKKPELWDGTAHLNKKDRRHRMEWFRSERKAETIRKWQEENEGFARDGQSPEPYENYASESEDEVIESLQTTPQSSVRGSPKRSRESESDSDCSSRKRIRPDD